MASLFNKQEREDFKREIIQEIDKHMSIPLRLLVLFMAVCALFKPGLTFLTIAISASRRKDRFAALGAMVKHLTDTED